MSELATVHVTERDGALIARVAGEVDISNATEVERKIQEGRGAQTLLVLDLSPVRFFDSSGIRMLFGLQRSLIEQDVVLAVVAAETSPVSHVLTMAGLSDVAPRFASVEQALAEGRG